MRDSPPVRGSQGLAEGAGALGEFVPPTPAQVGQLLDRHPLRAPSKLLLWLPMLALGLVLVLALSAEHLWALLGMIAAVVMVIAAVQVRLRQVRQLESQTMRVQELTMRRQYREALRLAWRTLPRCVSLPELYHRLVAAMAQSLDHLRCHEAAIVGYCRLLKQVPSDHPGALHVRVLKAIAQLSSDQLADADDELRRLRQSGLNQDADEAEGTERGDSASGHSAILAITRAAYHLACLLQQVRTYHYADAVAGLAGLQQRLRPLGVDAGHGYGLAALACQQHAQRLEQKLAEQPGPTPSPDEREDHEDQPHDQPEAESPQALRQQAGRWWSRATLLLPVQRLTGRFTEMSKVAEDDTLAGHTRSADPPEHA